MLKTFARRYMRNSPDAEGFIIDLTCKGILCELFDDELNEEGNEQKDMVSIDDIWTGVGMLDDLEEYKSRNAFTYKVFVFILMLADLCMRRFWTAKILMFLHQARRILSIRPFHMSGGLNSLIFGRLLTLINTPIYLNSCITL